VPIKPVTGMETPLPVDRPEDVAALVDLLPKAREDRSFRRGLTDHFAFLAGVHPEWFRPYQEVVVTELLDGFGGSFGDHCALLAGAPDRCAEHLLGRLRTEWSFHTAWALAAIGTEAALAAVAEDVRAGGDRDEYEEIGVWVPPTGPAQYRFSPHRLAVFRRPVEDPDQLDREDHPVGLPLDRVLRDPAHTAATWHYLSLRLAQVPGLPDWPAERVHLVSPRANWDWTFTARTDERGRYHDEMVTIDSPPDAEEAEYFRHEEEYGGNLAAVDLRPYDAELTYCNGHIQLTPGVVGTAGGPPLGLSSHPSCRSCGRLMFNVLTVEHHVRDYGDGFRCLFICERCQLATSEATGWN
jgi:hypothetical protein